VPRVYPGSVPPDAAGDRKPSTRLAATAAATTAGASRSTSTDRRLVLCSDRTAAPSAWRLP
jgi:hypothetical protein